jgi:hypothetical protein
MPSGGSLLLQAENLFLDERQAKEILDAVPGPYVVMTVRDSGTGIPDAVLEKIFEPFFTTKEPGRGTGLGLSTAHAIVKGHKGFMRVTSAVGQGTEFRIYLPAHGSAEPLSPAEEAEAGLGGKGELILVIDDERMILSMTEEMLASYGYETRTALHGKEGVAVFARECQRIAAVIVDMMMPHMDGAATIQALRHIQPGVRILAISGVPKDSRNEGERSLVKHFLAKPFTAQTLLKALRDVLESDDGGPASVGAVGEETAAA